LKLIDCGLTDSAAVMVWAMCIASGVLTSTAVLAYASGISMSNS
jgi:hypothetical protein